MCPASVSRQPYHIIAPPICAVIFDTVIIYVRPQLCLSRHDSGIDKIDAQEGF